MKMKVKSIKKIKPLGNTSPWCWAIELVNGCNLRCGHCSCRLNPPNTFYFMNLITWKNIWKIINHYTPTCRIDLVMAGKPTLHPEIYSFLKIARKISPLSQIQITTNGTMLISKKVTYNKLLNAGANIIYTDMYGPENEFIKMAENSNFSWYEYYNNKDKIPSPWTYYGPDLKLIVLQKQPENWPKSRLKAGLLGTWFNHLDWEAAKKFNLFPVKIPPNRRCNQPFLYVPVRYEGSYLLCCQDNVGETAGLFGNVNEGIKGFKKYWYGKKLQIIRYHLRNKNRKNTSQCSRCNITFSRCDFKHWTDIEINRYWNGKEWKNFKI